MPYVGCSWTRSEDHMHVPGPRACATQRHDGNQHIVLQEQHTFALEFILVSTRLVALRLCAYRVRRLVHWTHTTDVLPGALGTLADLDQRQNRSLLAENALLRHQLIILRRQVRSASMHRKTDRVLLVALSTGWFGHGSKRSLSFNQKPCCGGIVSSSACTGSAGRRPLHTSPRLPRKPSH